MVGVLSPDYWDGLLHSNRLVIYNMFLLLPTIFYFSILKYGSQILLLLGRVVKSCFGGTHFSATFCLLYRSRMAMLQLFTLENESICLSEYKLQRHLL